MIRQVFGLIISLSGLTIIAYSANLVWDFLARDFYDYTSSTAQVATAVNPHVGGPMVLISIAFLGGLVFVAGCVVSVPGQKPKNNLED